MFGAFLRFGNLDTGRAAAFGIFCFGLYGLSRALARAAGDDAAGSANALTLIVVAFSLPLVAYSELMYADILLFAVVSWSVFAVLDDRPYLAVSLAWLLPIVHIRSAPLALGLLALVAARTLRERRVGRGPRLCGLAGVLGVAFVVVQVRLYGNVTGPAFSTTQPSLGDAFERLGFALFDVRQGIITYAPCYLVGFAGLVGGAIRRHGVCLAALGISAAYVLGFMWSDAAESWPARFWVAAVPLLGIGIAHWLRGGRRLVTFAIIAPLLIVEVSNLVLFAMQPDWFLENRRTSLTYAILYKVAHVHFGTLLPIDGDAIHAYARPLVGLLAYTALLIVALALHRTNCRNVLRNAGSVASLGLVLFPFIACAFRTLPTADYRVSGDAARGSITLVPRRASDVAAVQLDDALPVVWREPDLPDTVDVSCRDAAGRVSRSVQPGRALILTPGCTRSTMIRLAALPRPVAERFVSAAAHVTVMQPIIGFR